MLRRVPVIFSAVVLALGFAVHQMNKLNFWACLILITYGDVF